MTNLNFRLPPTDAPGSIGIELDGVDAIYAMNKRWGETARAEYTKAINKSLALAARTLIPLMPEDTGAALRSIKLNVANPGSSPDGISLSASLGSDLDYMAPLEYGRAAGHFPPPAALIPWIERHWEAAPVRMMETVVKGTGRQANFEVVMVPHPRQPSSAALRRSQAFILARAIFKRGSPDGHPQGYQMFQKTLDVIGPAVDQYFADAIDKIMSGV